MGIIVGPRGGGVGRNIYLHIPCIAQLEVAHLQHCLDGFWAFGLNHLFCFFFSSLGLLVPVFDTIL